MLDLHILIIDAEPYSHQLKALAMMVEKESGRIEGNNFESLWYRVAQSESDFRYPMIDCSRLDL